MAIYSAHNFSGAFLRFRIKKQLAAQCRLHAGHQQRGGNSLSADICQRDPKSRRTELNEIVVVAADSPSRAASRRQFNSRKRWQLARKKLRLHFARDRNFIFQSLPSALLLDKRVYRFRHAVERIRQRAKLVGPLHANAMTEVAGLHELRRDIQIRDGMRNGARHHDSGNKRRDFEHEKNENDRDQQLEVVAAQIAERCEEALVELLSARGVRREHGRGNNLSAGIEIGVERGDAADFVVEK